MRVQLVDGHGNFGSLDDDPAAAMRRVPLPACQPAAAIWPVRHAAGLCGGVRHAAGLRVCCARLSRRPARRRVVQVH